jgi:hypothetical protein
MDRPLTTQQRTISVAVRLAGFSIPVLFALYCWYVFMPHIDEQEYAGPRSDIDTKTTVLSLFGFLLAAIIGGYIGIKGPLFGEAAAVNRRHGIGQCVLGIKLLVAGVVVNVVANLIGSIHGFFVDFFTGILALGALFLMIGITSVLTGRNIAAKPTSRAEP